MPNRYDVRWTNGHWIIFDNQDFCVARFADTHEAIKRIFEGR